MSPRALTTSSMTCAGRRLHTAFIAGLAAALGIVLAAAAPAVAALEFPGPRLMVLTDPGSAVGSVRVPGRASDDLVMGHANGKLSLFRYMPASGTFVTLQQLFLEGRLVQVLGWAGRPLAQPGLVVASRDPDRVYFVEASATWPYLSLAATVPLEEDPGTIAWFGDIVAGDPWLGVSLPGVDQLAIVADRGGWSVARVVDVGDDPHSLAGADLDGDGRVELVAAQRGRLSGDLCIVRRGAGDEVTSGFAAAPGLSAGLVAACDLEADGRAELAVADRDRSVVGILSEGPGGLAAGGEVGMSLAAGGLLAWTLAGGQPALLVSDPGRGAVEFASLADTGWKVHGAYFPSCRPGTSTVTDIDGDGLGDVATVSAEGDVATVMFARPGPGFWGLPSVALPALPGSVGHLDLDADGLRDVLVSSALGTRLSLFRGRPEGGLETTATEYETGFITGRFAALALDGDPEPELAVLDLLAGQVVVMDRAPGGGLSERSRHDAGDLPTVVESGDVDGDGLPDLLVQPADGARVILLYGEPGGAFGEPQPVDCPLVSFQSRLADLDGDGDLDLVAVDGLSRVWWRLNLGGRSFGGQLWINAGNGATLLETGDLDGDGDRDVVVGCRTDRSLTYFENAGNGTLVRRTGSRALDAEPTSLRTGDLDDDGRDDVVVVLRARGEINVFQSVLPWNNEFALSLGGTGDMIDFTAADLNRDGTVDLLSVDGSLRLGVAHLNIDPEALALEPRALQLDCRAGGLDVRVEPGIAGDWRLESRGAGAWRLLADAGGAVAGSLVQGAGTWDLRLSAGDLAAFGDLRELRLVVAGGEGPESVVAVVPQACAGPPAGQQGRPAWTAAPWPNPGNPQFRAVFRLPAAGRVVVSVHDVAGRRVAVLREGNLAAGDHEVAWDGRAGGRAAAAGTYLLRVAGPGGIATSRLVLLK